jgi:hypothetical protein
MTDANMPATRVKPENLWLNLTCNFVLPTAVQNWGSSPSLLGPRWALVVALVFPVGYGLHDFATRRRFNFISILGFASLLIYGGFGLMKLDPFWFAVKDAAIPGLIGAAVLTSMRAKEPLVHEMLYNPQVIDVVRVDAALNERGAQGEFRRLMKSASHLLALSFFLSAGLNFALARWLLKSPPGTEALNKELARMHWASLLGAMLPSLAMMLYALWRLLQGLERLTGLELDQILRQPPKKGAAPPVAECPADKPDGP